jgi:hypothetical protein
MLATLPVEPEPAAPARPAPAHGATADVTPGADPADDLVIIRGSHDPASNPLELLGTSADAPRPDEALTRPGLPATPEWGAPPTPRPPAPGDDDAGGSQSDG